MTLLNAIILWGLPVAAIPILIHWLDRRRHRTVDWGAMQFLLASHAERNRRIRWEEWLILAVRTLMLIALVVGMARLFVTNRRFASQAAGRQAVAVVLDTSMSMSRNEGGVTQLERAQAAASALIDALGDGDAVSIVAASTRAIVLNERPIRTTPDAKASLKQSIASLSADGARFDPITAIDAAHASLRDTPNPARRIVVITDGQAHGWQLDEARRWQFLADSLAEDSIASPLVSVLRLPGGTDSLANLAITDVSLDRRVVGTDRPARIAVEVKNSGQTATAVRTLVISVSSIHDADDAQRYRIGTLDVPALEPGAAETLTLVHRFERPGSTVVTASLVGQDDLSMDNEHSLAVDVALSLAILVVDGDPSPDPIASETGYLVAALAPSADRHEAPVDYVVRPHVVDVPAATQTDLSQFRVVVLANVPFVSDDLLERVKRFVEDGGGLFIAPGDRVDSASFNDRLFADGLGLSPVRLDALSGDAQARDTWTQLAQAAPDHPVMRWFVPPAWLDLSEIHIYRWFTLAVPGRTDSVHRLASLEPGAPWLIEKRFGRGRVIVSAVPWDVDWSNLPTCKAYVVLTHELMYYLAEPVLPRWHVTPGAPLAVLLDGPSSVGQIITPEGQFHAVTGDVVGGRATYRFDQTHRAGVYRFILATPSGRTTRMFSVGLDPDESNLSALSDDELVVLQEPPLAVAMYASLADALAAIRVEAPGREIWPWLFAAVLLLLVTEVVLTRAIARRRYGAASAEADARRAGHPVAS